LQPKQIELVSPDDEVELEVVNGGGGHLLMRIAGAAHVSNSFMPLALLPLLLLQVAIAVVAA